MFVGAIGFPVLFELAREWRTAGTWSTHTRLTVWGSLLLSVVGLRGVPALRVEQPGHARAARRLGTKVLAAFTQDVMTRSGGFNSIDCGEMNTETIAVTNA